MSGRPAHRVRAIATVTILAGLMLTSALPAGAVIDRPEPARLIYRCTVAATDLGDAIRVVYRLTSNGPHQHWRVRMWDQGRRFLAKQVRTGAGGDFRVRGVTKDHHGVEHLRASARRRGAGPTCRVVFTP